MPAPWIAIQFVDCFYQTCPQWIQMNVADQLKQIGIFLAGNGFIAVLEQVPRTFVLEIEDYGVAGKQAAHEDGEFCHPRAEEQMEVIGHERPGKAVGAGFGEKLGETLKE